MDAFFLLIFLFWLLKNYSLAAISTLYFVEHSKQIDRHYLRRYESNDFFSERNYLVNSSYGSNGIAGGGGAGGGAGVGGNGANVNGNILFNNNENYWNENRHNLKKVNFFFWFFFFELKTESHDDWRDFFFLQFLICIGVR